MGFWHDGKNRSPNATENLYIMNRPGLSEKILTDLFSNPDVIGATRLSQTKAKVL